MPFNSLTEINGNMLGQIRKHCYTAMCFFNDEHRIFDRFTSLLFSSYVICQLVSHLPHCAGSTVMFFCVSCTYSSSIDRGWIRLKNTPQKERLTFICHWQKSGTVQKGCFPLSKTFSWSSSWCFSLSAIQQKITWQCMVSFREPNH